MIGPARARELAELWLANSEPRRWDHVCGVGVKAESISKILPLEDNYDRDVLVAAGYVHDIGYASGLQRTGLHQLDGARFIRVLGDHRLACLVAHHSEARFEVGLRGYEEELSEYPPRTYKKSMMPWFIAISPLVLTASRWRLKIVLTRFTSAMARETYLVLCVWLNHI